MYIRKYVLVDKDDIYRSYMMYDDYNAAVADAGSDYAVAKYKFEFSESEIVYTPDGSGVWPPKQA